MRTERWEAVRADTADYLSAVIEEGENDGAATLYSRYVLASVMYYFPRPIHLCLKYFDIFMYCRVRLLLEKMERTFETRCWVNCNLIGCEPTYVNAPWTEIIMACIGHRISHLNSLNQEVGYSISNRNIQKVS